MLLTILGMFQYFFHILIWWVVSIILILVATAFYTLAERKIMASIQRRKGPNVVGLYGFLQPIADGLKLIVKNKITPVVSSSTIFIFSPLPILTFGVFMWCLIFFNKYLGENLLVWGEYHYLFDYMFYIFFANIYSLNSFWSIYHNFNYTYISSNLLIVLTSSSLAVYSIILSGWSSGSKYAFLGSLRSGAQMISYEVSIGLTILPVILLIGGSFDVNHLTLTFYTLDFQWNFFFLMPAFIIFFISVLAETNRTPFDLTEAEAELVAGYNVEYSSFPFAMFFLAEYTNMIFSSALLSFFFLGSDKIFGWLVEILFFSFVFVLVRATFPRYKYNDLMNLGWKIFLPVSLSFLVSLFLVVYSYNTQLFN